MPRWFEVAGRRNRLKLLASSSEADATAVPDTLDLRMNEYVHVPRLSVMAGTRGENNSLSQAENQKRQWMDLTGPRSVNTLSLSPPPPGKGKGA